MRRHEPEDRKLRKVCTKLGVSARICQVDRDGLFIEFTRLFQRFAGGLPDKVSSLQKGFVCGQFGRVFTVLSRSCGKLDSESFRNSNCDLVLDCENISHLTVITLRPEVKSIFRINELGRHSKAI